jgi:hypothetical protein
VLLSDSRSVSTPEAAERLVRTEELFALLGQLSSVPYVLSKSVLVLERQSILHESGSTLKVCCPEISKRDAFSRALL